MWFVFRAVNRTRREVYYGVSDASEARADGSHCVGGTNAISHWAATDEITWSRFSTHDDQTTATTRAQALGRHAVPTGYNVVKSAKS